MPRHIAKYKRNEALVIAQNKLEYNTNAKVKKTLPFTDKKGLHLIMHITNLETEFRNLAYWKAVAA